jgi:hypothetical protein
MAAGDYPFVAAKDVVVAEGAGVRETDKSFTKCRGEYVKGHR